MKKIKGLLLFVGLILLSASCEKESLFEEENLKEVDSTGLFYSSDETSSTLTESCHTIVLSEGRDLSGSGNFIRSDAFAEKGFYIYPKSSDGSGYLMGFGNGAVLCGASNLGITTASSDYRSRYPFLLNFNKGAESVLLNIATPLNAHTENITITAYNEKNGTGTVISTKQIGINSSGFSCNQYSVDGTGIKSIVITSNGQTANYVALYQVGFCDSPVQYCRTITMDNHGFSDGEQLETDSFQEHGFKIYTPNSTSGPTYELSENCSQFQGSLSDRNEGTSAVVLIFDEEVSSVSITAKSESPTWVNIDAYDASMNTIDRKSYSVLNGAADTEFLNSCNKFNVEGNGIKRVSISGYTPNLQVFEIKVKECIQVPDSDGDGINDDLDNCPVVNNTDQADLDSDGLGNVCDTDLDGDNISNEQDNCPLVHNSSQKDYDEDNQGDVCDSDDDNDGCLDANDANPMSNLETTIKIGFCDTGVGNRLTTMCGVMMSDLIDELESGEYKNLGQTIRTFNDLTEFWLAQELITKEEKLAIQSCVITSSK